ncbi:MAG TPA: BTAD domain-containing putative transcriptional regulator [Ktedonobacterales bacterium]|jgi:DNA-binding SARP family transcriptional activator/predicted ATPase
MALTLRIRLLGDFNLLYGDQPVTSLNTPRLQSLFAYLVLHHDVPQQRQHLAFLFWPDATEAQARNNLRQLIHQLRQAFPEIDQFLHSDTSNLHWRPNMLFRLDLAEFEQLLQRADEAGRQTDQRSQQSALEEADHLYRGPLLPSCYDDWIVPERERLRQDHLQALEHLLRLFERQGDLMSAIHYAQRLIRIDPLSEDLYRRLMRLHMLNNDRASALRVYHTCAATLQRELGVDPDQATRATYEQLLHPVVVPALASIEPPTFSVTPTLIGRKPEWEALHQAWQRAMESRPQFVLVSGEAGIGKSRLAEEFLAWASQQGVTIAKTRSYAAEGQLSLGPVADWLRSEGVRAHLEHLDTVWLTEIARILPELLAERPDVPHYEPMTEYGQRLRFFEALARATLVTSQPLLLVLDDLQWCDQETLEWLHFLLRFDPLARLLVIGCTRTEELPPQHPLRTLLLHLQATSEVAEIALQPLDAAETAKLAAQIAHQEWEEDALMHLYHETGGYPLFVVEMVRAGLGRSSAPEPTTESLPRHLSANALEVLPARVHAVLAGRLLQLSPSAQEVANLAATIGREFTLDLLIATSQADTDTAVRALDELWQKRIVREHGTTSYDFTHDKLREVAYAEISVPQRRLLHSRVAHALETFQAEDLDPVCGQIATHYERAGMIEQALPYYQRAAGVAQHLYANEEAINLLLRGLKLLEQLPAGLKHDQQELRLLLALAPLYRVTKGWAAPELEGVLDRMIALCDTVGDDTQRAEALYGLQSLYVVQAKLEKVQSVSDELQLLYQHALGTPPPLSRMVLAGAHLHLGRIVDANEQFAEILAAHDPEHLRHLQESQGANYAAHGRAWQAHALWCLGYPQQALNRELEAIRLVEALNQPFNQALVSAYLALLQQWRADEATARACAEEALELTSLYQAPYYRSWAAILGSYALALEQPREPHIGRLRASIDDFKASNARLRLPYYLSLLAHVFAKAGRAQEGLTVLDEALAEARAHNERWWNAEVHRLRGELLLLHGADAEEIEMALLRAIEIARAQQARSLELRATMSLARLRMRQGRADDARGQLSELYAWFTEGFDTPDLQAAQDLLAQL